MSNWRKLPHRGADDLTNVADLSDITSARRAAVEIMTLNLPIAGVLDNGGIMPPKPFKSSQSWDGTYATNHLGPFAFTEALIPHLADGTNSLGSGPRPPRTAAEGACRHLAASRPSLPKARSTSSERREAILEIRRLTMGSRPATGGGPAGEQR